MNFVFVFPIFEQSTMEDQKKRKKEEKQQKKQLMEKCIEMMEQFRTSAEVAEEIQILTLPSTLDKVQRKILHFKAQSIGLMPKYNMTGES